jgi:LmbE family N-acetylglucosaminyl deacetylase
VFEQEQRYTAPPTTGQGVGHDGPVTTPTQTTETSPARLHPYDDSALTRALAVVAHPDDMEYGGSAAVAAWTARGVEVSYVLVTRGEAGIDGMPPDEAGPLREEEQRAACAEVGVRDLTVLDFHDGVVEHGLPLRRAIAAQVRRTRPDVVLTGSFRETWPSGMLNQADHVAVGRAVVDACRDAGNRWVFPDLLDEGLEPWEGVREVLALGSPDATHAVVVEDTVEAAVRSLAAHERYMAGLGDGTTQARDVVEGILRMGGERAGVEFAVLVEVLRLR